MSPKEKTITFKSRRERAWFLPSLRTDEETKSRMKREAKRRNLSLSAYMKSCLMQAREANGCFK